MVSKFEVVLAMFGIVVAKFGIVVVKFGVLDGQFRVFLADAGSNSAFSPGKPGGAAELYYSRML